MRNVSTILRSFHGEEYAREKDKWIPHEFILSYKDLSELGLQLQTKDQTGIIAFKDFKSELLTSYFN